VLRRVTLVLTVTVLLAPAWVVAGPDARRAEAIAPAPNPQIEESCGLDVTLVLDASGSVSSSNAVDDVRNAADAMLTSLSGTNSVARVTQFATVAQQLAPSTLVDDASLAPQGVLRKAVDGYYNPIPPRPSNVAFWQYNSGSLTSSGSFSQANSLNQYTNWDQSLGQAGQTTPELVVYITDGDPTAYDLDRASDPFDHGPPPDVAVRTDRNSTVQQETLDRAVQEANVVKNNGTRMLAVGVGTALSNPSSQARLEQIAGPQVARDADIDNIDSINDLDVALVTDFGDLAQLMRSVVLQLCSPSLTIRKLAPSSDDATYAPASGWDMTVTPTVPGGTFDWILPNAAPATSKTVATDDNGFAQFQWEPDPPEFDSAAHVAEANEPGYTAGRPDGNDYRCELKDEDGNVRTVEGDFANPAAPAFDIDPIGQEIVTCTVYNSFDYEPGIALTKVNAPTELRGDLDPPADVTSTFDVTNPGDTPLDNVTVTDDHCGPVAQVRAAGANVGDTSPANGLLDPGETWQFRCVRPVQSPDSTDPDGLNIVNTAQAHATDPTGAEVTDEASDDVDAFNPAITIDKLVNGDEQVTVPSGQQVSYTYAVANAGNTPLGSVTLADDTPPCENPSRGADSPGDDDNVLDVGETWTYACDLSSPEEAVVNTATVTASPIDPVTDDPFAGRNPDVEASDSAAVEVVNPDISLTKAADPPVVLLGPATPPDPEPVTYTFAATNEGDTPLNRPGAATGGPGPKDPGWIVDVRCAAPAVFTGGDANGNDLLDPAETWTFTCPGAVRSATVNVARITGRPSAADGSPLPGVDPVSDLAVAVVKVVQPGIDITKTATRGVVLDPDADPVAGPDVPTPREAQYLYDVVNTGNVPLSLTGDGPTDDICAPLTLEGGDDNGDGLLDPDEVWQYSCSTTLERQQGNTPPVTGNESGLVTNTVTVTGVPFFDGALIPDKAATASDRAQVTVIEPSLTLRKTATPAVVEAGGEVVYHFRVRNTGDVGLQSLGPNDDKCAPLVFQGGDRNGNGLVDGADSASPETWRYTCTRPVGQPTAPDTLDVNTATVRAIDPLGNLYAATDDAQVRVIDPAIDLTKTVSASLVPAGHVVTYSFGVSNAGQSPIPADDVLANVEIGDVSAPANPKCARPTYVSGDTNGDGLLDREPPEVWTYRCRGAVTKPTTDVAVVVGHGGTQYGLNLPVRAADAAFVQPFHPGIQVVKSASPTVLLGSGDVTYTYEVRNTGDVPLADVVDRIADDTCAPVEYVSGDKDGDGLLDTENSIFEDALDETWVFTCTTNVDQTTTNTVSVRGTPVDPGGTPLCGQAPASPRIVEQCDVRDRDRATVTVYAPASISIAKKTTSATDRAFDFALNAHAFSLHDGDSQSFDALLPGAYRVREDDARGWQLSDIECAGPSGSADVQLRESSALITVDPGQHVSCTFTNEATGGGTGPPPPGDNENGGPLPGTGAPPWLRSMLALGALLTLVGAGLVVRQRRRWRPART
jgi:hypothetical protein